MAEVAAKPLEDSNLKSSGSSEGIISGSSETEPVVGDECTPISKGICFLVFLQFFYFLFLIRRGEVWVLIGTLENLKANCSPCLARRIYAFVI